MSKALRRAFIALLILISASLAGLVASSAIEAGVSDICVPDDAQTSCHNADIAVGADSCALFATPNGEAMLWLASDNNTGNSDTYLDVSLRHTLQSSTAILDISITVTDPAVLLGSVIQGGPAYNVYPGLALFGLHPPRPEPNSLIPLVSGWTACYYIPNATTTTQATTTTVPQVTTTTQGQTITTCDPYVCSKPITIVLN